jgi:hypothetical protein
LTDGAALQSIDPAQDEAELSISGWGDNPASGSTRDIVVVPMKFSQNNGLEFRRNIRQFELLYLQGSRFQN